MLTNYDKELYHYDAGLQALTVSIHRTKPGSQERFNNISLALNAIMSVMEIFKDNNFALIHLLFTAREFYSLAFDVVKEDSE
jgi:hypothetical protein